jgi:hypothetical protein
MNLTDDEMRMLQEAELPEEWDEACDAVKSARGGQYPPDWYSRVLQSGMLARKSFDTEIRVLPLQLTELGRDD